MTHENTLQPKIVLAVAAHPDDLECLAGGTIAQLVGTGAKVHYIILTDGRNGTSDTHISQQELVILREAEQQDAAEILEVASVTFGKFADGNLENSEEVRRLIVQAIRRHKPDTVICWDPGFIDDPARGIINHHDHRTAGTATCQAVYPEARDHLSFPSLAAMGLEPHKVDTVLMLTSSERANYQVKLSEKFYNLKYEAIRAHATQPELETEGKIQDGSQAGHPATEAFRRIDVR